MDQLPLGKATSRSIGLINWIHVNLNGITIEGLGTSKRNLFSAGCWHVAIEHHQGVVALVQDGIWGSALALLRPQFEAYVRGEWLMHAATDADIERAGRDEFPNDFFGRIVRDLEQPGLLKKARGGPALSNIKGEPWQRLCSLTHTGFHQIGARITPEGIGCEFPESEITDALGISDLVALMSMGAFAGLAKKPDLEEHIRDLVKTLWNAEDIE